MKITKIYALAFLLLHLAKANIPGLDGEYLYGAKVDRPALLLLASAFGKENKQLKKIATQRKDTDDHDPENIPLNKINTWSDSVKTKELLLVIKNENNQLSVAVTKDNKPIFYYSYADGNYGETIYLAKCGEGIDIGSYEELIPETSWKIDKSYTKDRIEKLNKSARDFVYMIQTAKNEYIYKISTPMEEIPPVSYIEWNFDENNPSRFKNIAEENLRIFYEKNKNMKHMNYRFWVNIGNYKTGIKTCILSKTLSPTINPKIYILYQSIIDETYRIINCDGESWPVNDPFKEKQELLNKIYATKWLSIIINP